jgi:Flp pilus assembly protein TadG
VKNLSRVVCFRNRVAAEARKALAVVELALVLPLLLLLFVVAVDFARVFYNAQVITDCARTAAMFASNPDLSDKLSFGDATELALRCAQDLKPLPTITISHGTDNLSQAYVDAVVTQQFDLIVPLMLQRTFFITRSARARLHPSAMVDTDE